MSGELSWIQEMIKKDCQVDGVIREATNEDLKHVRIYNYREGEKVYKTGIQNFKTGKTQLVFFKEEDTIEYMKKQSEDAETIIGYFLRFEIQIQSEYTFGGNYLTFEKVSETINEIRDWEIEYPNEGNILIIQKEIEGNCIDLVKEIEKEITALRLFLMKKYCHGFNIIRKTIFPRKKWIPFGQYSNGFYESISKFEIEDFKEMKTICDYDEVIEVLEMINSMYSQLSNRTKLAIGTSALETIFDTGKPQHILEKKEKINIKEIINTMNLSDEKISKINSVIDNPNFFSKDNRNERLAKDISKKTGLKEEEVIIKLKNIMSRRGSMIHNLNINKEISEEIEYIELILNKYIDEKYKNNRIKSKEESST